jgi:hypothetical protein
MINKLAILGIMIVGISCNSREEITRQQYVVEGMNLYQTNCANCHQVDGSGFKDLYPPLAKTDLWQRVKMSDLACIIKNGQKDSIYSIWFWFINFFGISFKGRQLQDDLKPVESNLISMDVSVSSAHVVIMDSVADDNFHIDRSFFG